MSTMGLHIQDVGDDGFAVYVPEGPKHFGDTLEIVEKVCGWYKVELDHEQTECNNDNNTVRVFFTESQSEDTVGDIEADLRQGRYVPATAPTEPTTRTFMVTTNWRGSMHVDPMRTFVVESEAREYANTLTGGTPVLYETFTSKPPKKLKV